MNEALKEAQLAFNENEVPIGCVIVNNDTHEIICRTHNLKESKNDVTAHAEILAIRKASEILSSWRLSGHTLYVTVEPCMMCTGAIIQSRIDRVVYGTREPRMGSLGARFDATQIEDTNIIVKGDVLKDECESLMKEFFKEKQRNI